MGEKLLLINAREAGETRVALVEDGVLEGFRIERASQQRVVGNIYKGRVVAVEPAYEAAFVDVGLPKHGFLHLADVRSGVGRRSFLRRSRKRTIAGTLRVGDEIMVQVRKEGAGDKGDKLSTYISLPGRYLVLMPFVKRYGVSRRLEDVGERERLRALLKEMDTEGKYGLIVRTMGEYRSAEELRMDYDYLVRLWNVIEQRYRQMRAPAVLYRESDLVTRVVRDLCSPDLDKIVVDSSEVEEKVRSFLSSLGAAGEVEIDLYSGNTPMFQRFGVEQQIEAIYHRRVDLPGGGYIVVEQTEAMVTIDVNSGSYRRGADVEETAFLTNMEAAVEIARQIRLRNLSGLIVVDFIDMKEKKHRDYIQNLFEKSLARDRARLRVLKMSYFGLIELTRQRMEETVENTIYEECPMCGGRGMIKTVESITLSIMRKLRMLVSRWRVHRVELVVHPRVLALLEEQKGKELEELKEKSGKEISIRTDSGMKLDDFVATAYDMEDREVVL